MKYETGERIIEIISGVILALMFWAMASMVFTI